MTQATIKHIKIIDRPYMFMSDKELKYKINRIRFALVSAVLFAAYWHDLNEDIYLLTLERTCRN